MANKYIVSHLGQEIGPYNENEIKQMLMSNQLLPVDYLYDEQNQDWILLSERFDLMKLAAAKAPPTSTPEQNKAYPSLRAERITSPAIQTMAAPATLSTNSPNNEPTVLNFRLDNMDPPPIEQRSHLKNLTLKEPGAKEAVTPPTVTLAVQVQPPVATTAAPSAPPQAPTATVAPSASAVNTSDVKPAPAPAVASEHKIKFNGGVGTVSLKQLRAGRVMIKLQDSSTPELSLPVETIVNVEAGPAKTITWQAPEQCQAGEEVEVAVVARDAFDNMTALFSGELELICKGQKTERCKVNFVSGRAVIKRQWTVAESLSLELVDAHDSHIALPAPKTLKVLPGSAVRLVVETPSQAVAGDNVPLTVKAVDQFGNLAIDYKGEIHVGTTLDPKAS